MYSTQLSSGWRKILMKWGKLLVKQSQKLMNWKEMEHKLMNRQKPGCGKGSAVDLSREQTTGALKKILKERMDDFQDISTVYGLKNVSAPVSFSIFCEHKVDLSLVIRIDDE